MTETKVNLSEIGLHVENHALSAKVFKSPKRCRLHRKLCGLWLLVAKDRIPHGDFQDWLRKKGVKPRTAQNYMREAKKEPEEKTR